MRNAFCALCLVLTLLPVNGRGFSYSPTAAAARNVVFANNGSAPRAALMNSAPTADEERLTQFERSLDLLRQQYKIPGLSAAVVHNRQLVWAQGFGFQDIAGGVPATPDTPYRIASLTKTFASMLLMRCVEQNRVDLNSLIASYTSSIPQTGVRIRHVFTHTSESTPPGEKYNYNGNR